MDRTKGTPSKEGLPKYREGDWFLVPIQPRGFGVGRIARLSGHGTVLGYFFGPPVFDWPENDVLEKFVARDATWVRQLGDLFLINGSWPLRRSMRWIRNEWPIPQFVRASGKNSQLVTYTDRLTVENVRPIAMKGASKYPRDAVSGALAVERVLTRILADDVTEYIKEDLDGARTFLAGLK